MIVFLNGAFVAEKDATVSVFDRGFLYGDGLFETLQIQNRRPFLWSQHIERLQRGADFLGIRIPYSPQELLEHATALLEKNQMPRCLLRLNLSRGSGPRGYSPQGADTPTLAMTLHPAPAVDPANPPRWRLATSSHRLTTGDPLSRHKTSQKLLQVLARAEAEAAGADEALLLNTRGEVTETSGANIFWIERGVIQTTPLDCGALPGVTRAVVLELCRTVSLPVTEKTIGLQALMASDGAFLTLTSYGIVPISSIDGTQVNRSPLVDQLSRIYWDAVASD